MSATHQAAPDAASASGAAQAEFDLVRHALAADYDLHCEIGRGGMAVVYRARERELDRDVAIKVLPSNFTFDEGFIERFQREARVSGSLEHPHIVPVYRVGRSGQVIYFVMKYLRGRSLAEQLQEKGALPAAEVRRILLETASAIGFAARRGIVHRDLKPDNIMLDEDGRCVVTDFGIARSASEAKLTATGMTVGTPRYMSPEQARSKPLDGRSDLYSLGIVAYECLVGSTPFDGEDAFGILMAHIKSPVPRPALRTPEERELWAVIERMLAKAPEHRFQAAEEVVAALTAPAGTGQGAAYAPTRPSGATMEPGAADDPDAPQSSAALDRALAAGIDMIRQQRPKLDAGIAALKAQKPKVDAAIAQIDATLDAQKPKVSAGLAAGRAAVEARRPAVVRGAQAVSGVVTSAYARYRAGGRRAQLALGGTLGACVIAYWALHFGIMHRSRCPQPGGTEAAGMTLLLDAPGTTRAGGDVEVYYDVCGLEKGAPYTARVTVTRNESGLKRLFGGSAGPVSATFDGSASGPRERRHESVELDGLPAGSYTLTVSVADERERRRTRVATFQVR